MGADAVNRLGFRLLDKLGTEPSRSVLFSPCSVAFCLALALNGAGGQTQTELSMALGLEDLAETEVNRRFRDLRVQLQQPGPLLQVAMANSVWGPPGAAFDPGFLRRVEEFYAAPARTLAEAGAAGARVINGWVNDRTNGRITTLVSPEDLAAGPNCILTNAVYFKGPWATPFDPGATRAGSFQLTGGRRKDVALMNRTGRFPYLETDDFQAVALDYADSNLSAYVVLPAKGSALDASRLETSLRRLRAAQVALTLPRFSATSQLNLVRPLAELGMSEAFAPGADFSRMGITGSFISAMPHAARIDVSEEGTEAAASTAVVLGRSLPSSASMVVDRPFLLAVVDRRNSLLLFLGRITEPEPIPPEPTTTP